jgi:hypothetical protein
MSDAAILYVLQGGQTKSGRKDAEKTAIGRFYTTFQVFSWLGDQN